MIECLLQLSAGKNKFSLALKAPYDLAVEFSCPDLYSLRATEKNTDVTKVKLK